MCGIAGVWTQGAAVDVVAQAMVMNDRLTHRGPDDSGVWSEGGMALAHRRLAIIDVTTRGSQPMQSRDGRWVLSYNGELYNARTLMHRLHLVPGLMRGHSDTEVLVEAIAQWGVERSLNEAVGMFAFAAWDRRRGELWLARDRFGEKPLYYTGTRQGFFFASELSALEAGLASTPQIDRTAVTELLRRQYISAPRSIYEGVSQLPPGSWLVVRDRVPASPVRYWDPINEATSAERVRQPIDESVDQLDEILDRTIRSRLVSDVPLGAFLSGGIDSATVVSLMQRHNPNTKTFTVGFEGRTHDESAVARLVADHLGTAHHEEVVSGRDALAVVPRLARTYGEPFADPSQIPTLLVCEHARRHVTVALSGDAGDELFGGYERYRYFERLRWMRSVPGTARRAGARMLEALPPTLVDGFADSRTGALLPAALRNRPATRTRQLARMLRASSEDDLYRTLIAVNDAPGRLIAGDPVPSNPPNDWADEFESTRLAMMTDTVDYLPNDILTKLDRAAMAVGLETRVPFLDPELFRFVWSLPTEHLVQNGVGKQVLRRVLGRYVPEEITSLPKRGFGVPLDDWLRGPLSSWASDLLDPQLVAEDGVLQPSTVQRLWKRHQQADENLGPQLWPIVMFQSWRHDR